MHNWLACIADAVLVTGVMAFTAVQQNIGAMNFMTQLKNNKPQKSILADPKKCLTGGYVNQALDKTFMRQMKCVPVCALAHLKCPI